MSMSFESDINRIIVYPDCDGEQEKRTRVFLADIFAQGGMGDLNPHNFQEVAKPIAPDVDPRTAALICSKAGVQLDIR